MFAVRLCYEPTPSLAHSLAHSPQRKYNEKCSLEHADDFYKAEEYHQKYLLKAMRSGGPSW